MKRGSAAELRPCRTSFLSILLVVFHLSQPCRPSKFFYAEMVFLQPAQPRRGVNASTWMRLRQYTFHVSGGVFVTVERDADHVMIDIHRSR